jgi:hypothetical protein
MNPKHVFSETRQCFSISYINAKLSKLVYLIQANRVEFENSKIWILLKM